MSKKNALHELADFYSVCQKAFDPEERSKALADWASKQPENVKRLLADGIPVLANVGKRIAERRVPKL